MVFWTSVGYSNKPHSPAFAPPRARPGLLSFALWRQRAPKLILTPKDETCLTRPQPSPLRSSSLHGKSGAQDKSGWKCSSGEGVRGASRYPHPAWGGPDRQTDRQTRNRPVQLQGQTGCRLTVSQSRLTLGQARPAPNRQPPAPYPSSL